MKMFMDMEFTGLHQGATPISLALRAQDGHEFYAEFTDYDQAQINPWLLENVVKNLIIPDRQTQNAGPIGTAFLKGRRDAITFRLSAWLDLFDEITIIGDCLAYDWVLFCELFGGARQLPGHMNYIPIDLSTVLAINGIDPDTSREGMAGQWYTIPGTPHNALHDVRVIAAIWDFLEYDSQHRTNRVRPNFFRDGQIAEALSSEAPHDD